MNPALVEVVERFHTNPGISAKADLRLLGEILGPTDWLSGPGDDAALLADSGGEQLLAAGEAIHPPLVATDPRGAGIAAVVANVNDVAAMGGDPIALVDTIVAPQAVAREVLRGLRDTAALYRVPVVGGHLTVRDGEPAVSAFVLGTVRVPLAAVAVRPGQALLAAYCLDGRLRRDFPFMESISTRGTRLRDDLALLRALAEGGTCVAARDISMGGLLGSLGMLLEPTGTGAAVDLACVPRPRAVSLARWLAVFPTYGFLLCAPPRRVRACIEAFTGRDLDCARIGEITDDGTLTVSLDGEQATLVDLRRDGLTHVGRAGAAT